MGYCGPRGIPYLHFLGGPPGWAGLSRQAALAWLELDRVRCPTCGTYPAIWDEGQGGDLHALAAVPVHCRGCEVKAGGDEQFERDRALYRRGTTIQLRPVADLALEVAPDAEGDGNGGGHRAP